MMNSHRVAWGSLVVALLGLALALPARSMAADKMHDGKVVAVTEGKDGKDGKLVMSDKDGKNEKTHMVPAKAEVKLDMKSAKLGDLKKGDAVTVVTDDKGTVKEVSAKRTKA